MDPRAGFLIGEDRREFDVGVGWSAHGLDQVCRSPLNGSSAIFRIYYPGGAIRQDDHCSVRRCDGDTGETRWGR